MSIKTNISYLFSLALLPLLAACGQDSSPLAPTPPVGDEPVEIRLAARMTGVDVSVTRAEGDLTDDFKVAAGSLFGVYGVNLKDDTEGKDLSVAYIDNSQLTAGAPQTTAGKTTVQLGGVTEHLYLPAGKQSSARLHVYAPYSETTTENGSDRTIPVMGGWVKTTQEGAASTDATDPLWATATATKPLLEEGEERRVMNIEMALQHRMARLNVHVSSKAGQSNLTGLRVTFANDQKGTMSLNSGTIAPANQTATTYTENYSPAIALTEAATRVSSHTVLPGSNAVTAIDIEIDGEWYSAYTSEAYADHPINFTAGNITNVTITFNPQTAVGVTMPSWQESEDPSFNHEFDAAN